MKKRELRTYKRSYAMRPSVAEILKEISLDLNLSPASVIEKLILRAHQEHIDYIIDKTWR